MSDRGRCLEEGWYWGSDRRTGKMTLIGTSRCLLDRHYGVGRHSFSILGVGKEDAGDIDGVCAWLLTPEQRSP